MLQQSGLSGQSIDAYTQFHAQSAQNFWLVLSCCSAQGFTYIKIDFSQQQYITHCQQPSTLQMTTTRFRKHSNLRLCHTAQQTGLGLGLQNLDSTGQTYLPNISHWLSELTCRRKARYRSIRTRKSSSPRESHIAQPNLLQLDLHKSYLHLKIVSLQKKNQQVEL